MREIVTNLLRAALLECCPPRFIEKVTAHPCFALAVQDAKHDLEAFASKDPASQGAATAIAFGYSSYKAVLHYRLAHALLLMVPANQAEQNECHANALLISCRGKLMSGAEIHVRSQIGRRFVLDHGCGTVIGETAVIGDDCYVLGGVTLGATGIAGNPSNKRHPTVGNRVQIGAFAQIFGDVHVGDDVFIGPHCVIKEDIPPLSVVTLRSELQTIRRRQYRPVSDTLIKA